MDISKKNMKCPRKFRKHSGKHSGNFPWKSDEHPRRFRGNSGKYAENPWIFWEHPCKFRGNSAGIPGMCRETFRDNSAQILRKFWEHPGQIREHAGNCLRNVQEISAKRPWTFRENPGNSPKHSGNIPGQLQDNSVEIPYSVQLLLCMFFVFFLACVTLRVDSISFLRAHFSSPRSGSDAAPRARGRCSLSPAGGTGAEDRAATGDRGRPGPRRDGGGARCAGPCPRGKFRGNS